MAKEEGINFGDMFSRMFNTGDYAKYNSDPENAKDPDMLKVITGAMGGSPWQIAANLTSTPEERNASTGLGALGAGAILAAPAFAGAGAAGGTGATGAAGTTGAGGAASSGFNPMDFMGGGGSKSTGGAQEDLAEQERLKREQMLKEMAERQRQAQAQQQQQAQMKAYEGLMPKGNPYANAGQ